ncbi:hypothetical protein OH77DRAFT_632907 [Trametes cingulata]|nr:hypothetical protein OH77DRAFT_632907 [Trametes cingulata]
MSQVPKRNQGHLTEDGMAGIAGIFSASEVLIAVKQRKYIVQTPAHDLQSFCWTILYVVYKAALKPVSGASLKGWSGEDTQKLKKEYKELFAAATVQSLLMQRSRRLGPFPAYEDRPSEDTRNWGIAKLMDYCTATAQEEGEYLEALIEYIWDVLKRSEPKTVEEAKWKRYGFLPPYSPKDDDGESRKDGDKGTQTMSTASIEVSGSLSSPEHARLIEVLETLLTYMEAS